jgi:hypothetical protein
MSSQARRTREEERRINLRTLVIASVASAMAAIVTSQFWIAGTPIAAAVTPVIVTLVSEILNRPTEKLAERFTSEADALPDDSVLPEAAGAGSPPPEEAIDPHPARAAEDASRRSAPRPSARPAPGGAGTRRKGAMLDPGGAPVKVYRQPSPAGVRARESLPWRTILVTAALAFVIAAAVLTLPELIAGQSLGKGNGSTSILGNNRHRSSAQPEQKTTPAPVQTAPQTTGPTSTPEQTTPSKEPQATTPKGTGTTQKTTPSQTPSR